MAKRAISYFSEEVMQIMPHILKGIFRRPTDALGTGKITVPQFLSLAIIDTHNQWKMKDIAAELSISLPAASGLINRLFKSGLVRRVYDQSDRRIIRIVLSPKGRKVFSQIKAQRRKAIEEVFGKLSEKERETYLKILEKLMRILYPKIK